MLQQTQVATVIPYYERWMREVPDIRALARLDDARLLKLWEGLGYYSRARNLKRAALEIIARHGGVFPKSREHILALPGIGPYTAGAISSLAFNLPEPVVDGNVARVLARVFLIQGDPKQPAVSRRLWKLASALARAASDCSANSRRPCGDLNESLMELGALVCLPLGPRCPRCPIAGLCRARSRGMTDKFPQIPPRKASVKRRLMVLALARGGRVFVTRRGPAAPNAGFWELPSADARTDEDAGDVLARLLMDAETSRPVFAGRTSHSIMNQRIMVECHRATLVGGEMRVPGKWVSKRDISNMPLSTISRKALALFENAASQLPCPVARGAQKT
jgi:A/G-specific adenine glycosylase